MPRLSTTELSLLCQFITARYLLATRIHSFNNLMTKSSRMKHSNLASVANIQELPALVQETFATPASNMWMMTKSVENPSRNLSGAPFTAGSENDHSDISTHTGTQNRMREVSNRAAPSFQKTAKKSPYWPTIILVVESVCFGLCVSKSVSNANYDWTHH